MALIEPGFVEPAYGDRSLGDILPAVAAALGVNVGFHDTALVLPPAQSYVVLLVDGLGHDLLRAHPEEAPYLYALLGEPGVAGVPSTTVTSLTSLGTALSDNPALFEEIWGWGTRALRLSPSADG